MHGNFKVQVKVQKTNAPTKVGAQGGSFAAKVVTK